MACGKIVWLIKSDDEWLNFCTGSFVVIWPANFFMFTAYYQQSGMSTRRLLEVVLFWSFGAACPIILVCSSVKCVQRGAHTTVSVISTLEAWWPCTMTDEILNVCCFALRLILAQHKRCETAMQCLWVSCSLSCEFSFSNVDSLNQFSHYKI